MNNAARLMAVAVVSSVPAAFALADQQHSHGGTPPAPATLGDVHFPVSCTPQAQVAFDDGMKLQHSFWYQAARQSFEQALARDPNCAMALWGHALTLLNNPFTPPTADRLRDGRALLEQAKRMPPRSEREAGFIDALLVLFASDDVAAHRARIQKYAEAMQALNARFPDDSEVTIATALALIMAQSPTDKTYANLLRAGPMLEREFERHPQHPGISHYLIHTYDVPALAARGLPAAERYAGLAADAPHALHMPSHIFTRVGRWDASIETNARSAETARMREETFDEVHALDYMVYGYLQTGRPAAAARVLGDLGRLKAWTPDRPLGGYALTAMPARYALERGAWDEAASLDTRTYGVPYVDATTHVARAMGAARAGRPEAAAADIEALKKAAAALAGRDAYWQEQIEIQRIAAEGWVAVAQGRQREGLALLREAADREGRTEKHPVTPGPLSPAREQLAEALLIVNRPAEALVEFEAVQVTEPRRFRAVYGAGRAAELAGEREAARRHYTQLLEIAADADTPLPELATARKAAAQP